MDSLVLLSGGLDSAVLAAQEARTRVVHPVYVAGGLAWEEGEQRIVEALLSQPPFSPSTALRASPSTALRASPSGALRASPHQTMPLARLEFNMRDLYPPSHWALRGTPPAYDTPDEDVYLHGRNIALLSKAAVYAAARSISRIVVAPLAGNPFPDATPQFFSALSTALSMGLAAPIVIDAPFAHLHKEDVVRLGAQLGVPFELTLSCMNPSGTTHCGLCSKCRERRDAFHAAGINDPTTYANISPR